MHSASEIKICDFRNQRLPRIGTVCSTDKIRLVGINFSPEYLHERSNGVVSLSLVHVIAEDLFKLHNQLVKFMSRKFNKRQAQS